MASTNASDTQPYDLQKPSNAHVFLSSNIGNQSPVFGDCIDTQLTTSSHINLQTYFLGVEHSYHDTSISFQYSEAIIHTFTCIDTTMVHSPYWDIISALFLPVESAPSHELKRQMFQYSKVDTISKQNYTVLNPMYTMFNFLRRAAINVNASLTSLNTGKQKSGLRVCDFLHMHLMNFTYLQ